MIEIATTWAAIASVIVAAGGSLYALAAATAVRGFSGDRGATPEAWPGVTLLKPVAGDAPGLYANLLSFCDQDYSGPTQTLFGVHDPDDPAIAIIERLISERSTRNLELVVHTPEHRQNPKVANLAGLEARIRHEVVVIADADIHVARDYLRHVVEALTPAGVGAVTCLYRGVPRGGIWAQLASMGIDYHFLPGVVLGLRLGLARPCFGSTVALTRATLESIGGFNAFAGYLADDYAIGEAIRARHLKVAIPASILDHDCAERSARELLRHELRWARTLRAVEPVGYAGSIITHPLPFAMLAAALTGFGSVGWIAIAAALGCRLVLELQVDHTLGSSPKRAWLGPVRDLLAFAVYVASFFVDVVRWGGQRYRIAASGAINRIEDRNG